MPPDSSHIDWATSLVIIRSGLGTVVGREAVSLVWEPQVRREL